MNHKSAIPSDSVDTLLAQGWLLLPLSPSARNALIGTFSFASTFFKSSSEEKNLNRLSEDVGYRPAGIEYSQSPDRPDPIESFTVDFRTRDDILTLPFAPAVQLSEQMLVTLAEFEALAESLIWQLAREFGRPNCDQLIHSLHRWTCLQVNYSRPAETDLPFIHESHEDGHLLTLAAADQPGIEIQTGPDQFLPVDTSSDHVLVMPGEILWLLTGGKIRPLYHRVRARPEYCDRTAVLLFADLEPHLCQPWLLSEINEHVDIGARILSNARRFGLEPYLPE